jgi:predicted ester cyclase
MSADRLTEMSTDPSTSSRKEEENKVIVDRWLTNFWGKNYNLAIVDELAARDIFFNHSLHTPRVGPVSLKTFMAELREAFPDLSVEKTADLIAEGDAVIIRWVCEGTHIGPSFYDLVMGALPAVSGRKMRFAGMSAIRLGARKIIENLGLADGVTAMNQLGFIRIPVWPA